VKGRVDQSNSVSLQTRVREIIDELPESIRKMVTRDSDEFAKRVVKTRDALTHYIPESKEALMGSDLQNAVVGLRILLTVLLLRELGVEEGIREEAITKNERFLNPWYVDVEYESKQD
jgi:HEPN superfamily Apea-like protein